MVRIITNSMVIIALLCGIGLGQIPQTLSYQGVLKEASGNIVPNGTYNLTFRIYNTNTGGSALWTEAQAVPVVDGIFSVILGSTVVLSLPFDVPYWLGITVGTGSELSPRIQLTSAAYSLNSNSVVNNAVTTAKIADGAVTQVKLAPGISLPPGGTAGGDLTGTYPNPTIAANAVNTAKINDGAVTQAKLAPGVSLPPGGTAGGDLLGSYPNPSVDGLYGRDISSTPPGPGQVLKWDGNYWSPSDDNAGMGLTLPYNGSANNPGANTFYVTNSTTSNGDAIVGKQGNGSSIGTMTSAAIWGTAEFGHGVVGYGSNAGSYAGVLGRTVSPVGYGVRGGALSGYGVYGIASSTGGYGVYGLGESDATGGYFSSETGAALITGTGNVGIGVNSPGRKLQVDGDIGVGYSGHYVVGAYPGLWWNSGNGAGFSVFAALLPTMQAAWQLSNTEAGIIEGAFLVGYLGGVPFLVAMTDRHDARAIYLVSTLLAVIGNLGTAFLGDGIWTGILTRLLAGMGLAGTFMPGLKLLTERLTGIGGNRAIAFYMATFSLGASVSTILAGLIGHRFGWQAPFLIAGCLGVLAIPLVLGSTRPSPRSADGRLPLWRRLALAARNDTARGYSLAYGLHMWELYGFRSWLIAFLVMVTTGHLGASADSSLTTWGGLVLFLGLPASVLGNELALRIGRRRWLGFIMPASAALSLVVGWSVDWPLAAVLCLLALYTVTVSADSATLTAGAVESAPAEFKGATMALHTLIGFAGASLGPLAVGGLLDIFGAETRLGWVVAFAAMGLVAGLGPRFIRRPS